MNKKAKEICKMILDNYKDFKDYFYKTGYDDEDLDLPYIVIGALSIHTKEKYLDNEYNLIGDYERKS